MTSPGTAPAPSLESRRKHVITLPAGLPLINTNRRLHRMAVATRTSILRDAALTMCRADKALRRAIADANGGPVFDHAWIIGVYHPARGGRVDPANYYPTFKACVDGIVDAAVIADDDSTRLIGPDMRRGPAVKGGQIVLRIYEAFPGIDGWLGETETGS